MSQLERLARPFPAKYVRAPAKGKFGEYVPHHVVTQALLAIVGPFDLEIGEILKGDDGKIEGCLVTLTCRIDGELVRVEEVGDCEVPGNWKTQGARMKDAISDGVKRCAARLGCGLHLWAGSDFFLYDQLRQEIAGANQQVSADKGESILPPAAPATSPASSSESAGTAGPSDTSSADGPASSKGKSVRRENIKARCIALQGDNVSVADKRAEWQLPTVDKSDDRQLGLWEQMLSDLEASLTAPFVEVPA